MTVDLRLYRAVGPCLVALFQGLSPAAAMPAQDVWMHEGTITPAVEIYKDTHMHTSYMDYRRRLEEARSNGTIETARLCHLQADAPKLSLI